MNNIEKILIEFNSKYSNMEIQDILKLIYQSEFGGGHLIKNNDENYLMLMNEWTQVDADNQEPLFEDIGDRYARFNIRAANQLGISTELFQKIFLKSVDLEVGTIKGFYKKVKILIKLCDEHIFSFSSNDIEKFLDKWESNGRPLFSHSAKYRSLYNPSYRVVSKEFIELLPIFIKIENEMNSNGKVIVGIDGRCGAGKTTLSSKIANFYDVQVIHMDDFFLPPELRSEERLSEPGGNVHYERFYEEVADKIKANEEVKYRVFSCRVMDYAGEVTINYKGLIVVEGSYSMHPLFEDIYNVKLFCDVDTDEQKIRIIKRNGPEMYKNFETKWIPKEETYFSTFRIKEKCDYVLM